MNVKKRVVIFNATIVTEVISLIMSVLFIITGKVDYAIHAMLVVIWLELMQLNKIY